MTAELLREIASVKKFVKGRTASAGTVGDSMLDNLAASLVKMIKQAPVFGAAEGGQLEEELAESPYGENGTLSIQRAIDARVEASTAHPVAGQQRSQGRKGRKAAASSSAVQKNAASNQYLKHWWYFLTAMDWATLKDPKASFATKITKIIERANRLGITDPSEQCFKWMMAALLSVHYETLPTYQQIYEKLQELKLAATSEKKAYPNEQLLDFPDSPSDLPQVVFNYAYDEDDPPVKVELHGVLTVSNHIPLRSNSKLLKLKRPNASAELGDSFSANMAAATQAAGPALCARRTRPGAVKHEPTADTDEVEAPPWAPQAGDPDRALWDEFQAYMRWKAPKLEQDELGSGAHVAPAGPAARASISIARSSNGALRLQPRTNASPLHGEQQSSSEPAPKAGPDIADECEELDEYTKQAIASLSKRNTDDKEKKKAEQAAKKAAKKAAGPKAEVADADAASHVPTKGRGRGRRGRGRRSMRGRPPAASGTSTKHTKLEMKSKTEMKIKKETKPKKETKTAKDKKVKADKHTVLKMEKPTRKRGCAEMEEVPKSLILKKRPRLPADGSNPAPVFYNGGVIYTSRSIKKFRALRKRGDKYSEKAAGWTPGTHGDMETAWKVAVKAIDEYQRDAKDAPKKK